MGDERRDVGGEERLALADPHHQRRVAARAHDHVRLVRVDRDQGERALQTAAHQPHGLGEVAAGGELLGEQMGDDLGVRLGGQVVAALGQFGAEGGEVLDDAVVDDGDPARVVEMRMRVGVGRPAVGGPAGVADPVVPAGNGRSTSSFSRLTSFPAFFAAASPPSARTATPAESYPRYSSRFSPGHHDVKSADCDPTYPTIPHMAAA